MKIVLTGTPEIESKGKYNQMVVNYNNDGKQGTRKVVSFGDSESVYNMLKTANSGDAFEIKLKKDGKYWNWVGGEPLGKEDVVTGVTVATSGKRSGDWETREERAARQVYIVRQSSLSNAITYYQASESMPSPETIIELAKMFERYVFETDNTTEVV